MRRNIRVQVSAAIAIAIAWGGMVWAGDVLAQAIDNGWAAGPSAARLLVEPRKAEVYVDGLFAGLVDDFDGFSQRLRLPSGEHEITFYLDGYRPLTQRVLFRADQTYKLSSTLEKLTAGEPMPVRPKPLAATPGHAPDAPGEPGPPEIFAPAESRAAPAQAVTEGTLSIRVQPTGAHVRIDGERWDGPAGAERLAVQLAEGAHRVEVDKDGYRRYANDVVVRRGEITRLNVSLLAVDR